SWAPRCVYEPVVRQFAIDNNLSFYDLRNNTGLLRTMMIRITSTGEVMIVMSFGEDDPKSIELVMEALKNRFPDTTSLMYVVNTKANDTIGDLDIKLYAGRDYIEEDMEGLKFRIGPKSFYQTNSRQAYRLYSVARDMAQLSGNELVYDLYTGTGTIANFIARNARKVIGIEYVEDAIKDARINSAVNGIDNTLFYAGDMKDVLTDDFVAQHGRPDVMIVDPPRAGMHENVVNVILNAEPQLIVYVSCNPATQARDLALLDAKYKVEAVQPVDMFPHTHHVENVVRLVRK
ncbi:MAG: 23S rRNA (uracil(1939)-C(5))-methyltransferase RlmD, partial [Muribaculaceae bacterium]|nr:23S rRNA (uracil(1939)-C(5))-methyltransferase RlmD [Muribaculaceae bacterium]